MTKHRPVPNRLVEFKSLVVCIRFAARGGTAARLDGLDIAFSFFEDCDAGIQLSVFTMILQFSQPRAKGWSKEQKQQSHSHQPAVRQVVVGQHSLARVSK